jgi:hypothetical protein
MATRYSKAESVSGVTPSGYEKDSPDSLESIPSCGIEDVDRAFFELFSEKLPLFYKVSKDTGEQRRVPVVFASGERFAVLSKSTPLRDKNGALILPMISITRNGLEFETTKGAGTSDRYPETIIKKKLSPEDAEYQNLINSSNLNNSQFSMGKKQEDWLQSSGRLLYPKLNKNIYEVTVIPTPKYFTAKFEVNIWCQYVQQLNTILETILGSYIQPGGRTMRVETKKGYWFVAYFDQSITQDNNFSDYTESERLVKATMTVEVPAYLILPKAAGLPNGVKKYTSAPNIVFEIDTKMRNKEDSAANIGTGDINEYILSDVETTEDEYYGNAMGTNGKEDTVNRANKSQSGINEKKKTNYVGKTTRIKNNKKILDLDFDPVTGEKKNITVQVIDSNPARGEEVYMITLDNRRK